MHVYKTLRALVIALRAVEVNIFRAAHAVADGADAVAYKARKAAHFALDRQEDKAFNHLFAVRNETEIAIGNALDREDAAQEDYTNRVAAIADIRGQLDVEVL